MDLIISQDPTQPGVLKGNGPQITSSGKIVLSGLDPTGAVNGNAIVLTAGVWAPGGAASSDTASNVGAGTGTIFKQKTGANFEFKTLIAGSNITLTNGVSDIIINSTATGSFTTSFTSGDQAITYGGALTIAHGLGAMPTLVQLRLRNTAAEDGYSIGDEVIIQVGSADTASSLGISVVPDAANLNIRWGTGFQVNNKGTGAANAVTAASWVMIIRAWR